MFHQFKILLKLTIEERKLVLQPQLKKMQKKWEWNTRFIPWMKLRKWTSFFVSKLQSFCFIGCCSFCFFYDYSYSKSRPKFIKFVLLGLQKPNLTFKPIFA